MGCLLALLAMLAPRFVMLFILLLTNWFGRAYDTVLWPLLGFVFMPYATLAYMGAMLNTGALQGPWLVIFIIAVIVDIGHWGGGAETRRRRRRS